MEWYYHNASVVNVTEENLNNGIVKQVYRKPNGLGTSGMLWLNGRSVCRLVGRLVDYGWCSDGFGALYLNVHYFVFGDG